MQVGKRYSFIRTIKWTRNHIIIFILLGSFPVLLYHTFGIEWAHIPWQPISLIGIAVAFYLGFKNNSSYERLWEARKIWGGVVNASRSFAAMSRDFINGDLADEKPSDQELLRLRKQVIHRHVAWLHCLTFELRKPKTWEHNGKRENEIRKGLNLNYRPEQFDKLKTYLSEENFQYVMSKSNRSAHILSTQSKQLMELRKSGLIDHFRHLELQRMLTEFYALQGKSERIKNFPFPRQYATVNYFFVILFIVLLPFGMLDVFIRLGSEYWVWWAVPSSVVGSWVFWVMELVGDYSENPFEGLFNDVPISTIANGIEIDIREMLDETALPKPLEPIAIDTLNIAT